MEPVRIGIIESEFERLRDVLKKAQAPKVYFTGTTLEDIELMRKQAEKERDMLIAEAISICDKYSRE